MKDFSPYRHPIEVRFRDLDGLGHINNAVYLTYIELCRTRFFQKAGFTALEDIRKDFPLILARTEIDFLMQGGMQDSVVVEGWISAIGNKSFTQNYAVTVPGRGVLAQAKAVLVWFDFAANTSVPIPDAARKFLQSCLQPDYQPSH